ncbi:MAG: V-type ATP synthase subunit F [Candidatus Thermoplasmatota archaeon]|nr:V-type ATP synthase subunit F [Candidatus Thermoplasmatota archaeon]MCL5731081.1 V-type ATP synthase subunit F [Candidatus Thermoplasmatota archaeon]
MNIKEIAFIGEDQLSRGFRLVGIESTINAVGEEGALKLTEAFNSGKYSVIMVSDSIRKFVDRRLLSLIDISPEPLVIFLPVVGAVDEESVEVLAKRILGVDIGGAVVGDNS